VTTDATDWRERLRNGRRELGLSRAALAQLANVSPETVRGYENGRRRPTREHLLAIIEALRLPPHETNAILSGAGHAPIRKVFPAAEYPHYYFHTDELQAYVERQPWPEFVLNQAVELMAANSAAQALWGIDLARELARRKRSQMNLLSVASQRRFADRLTNWEEIAEVLVAVFKGQPRGAESIDDPSVYFSDVLAEFARGDPAFLPSLAKIWERTPAREAKCHWSYGVTWRDAEAGELRFRAVVSTASEPDGFAFNSWIPLDAATWTGLERVMGR